MMFDNRSSKTKLPELLCPVGSVDALNAAVAGGADAVYMGTSSFNARMHAHPFTREETEEAIRLAHVHGVKVYITLNTVVMDRELGSWLDEAEFVYRAGADGLIIADIGAASLLHQHFPDFPLHASTQMSVHHSDAGTMLKDAGFSRMVVARETSFEDLKTVCEKSPIEIECFIHGALCVSHSGQCLFSSLVGGRSGNRGECAQPCRLPYQTGRTQSYPLSLKDLSLAQHVPELLACGLASLKIEGRMKSPDYVYTVTKIWRTLLDEKRSATPAEMDTLSSSFSRDGFTDGYFTSHVQGPSASGMLGVRTDQDKAASAQSQPFSGDLQKKPLDITFSMRKDAPLELELSLPDRTDARVHVEGPVPELARTQPLNRDQIHKQLCKFGNTPFEPARVVIDCDDGLMVPVSALNNLRRSAVSRMFDLLSPQRTAPTGPVEAVQTALSGSVSGRTAYCYDPQQITETSRSFFDIIYLPVWKYDGECSGIALPPVIFDHETNEIQKMIERAEAKGAKHVLLANPWHLNLVKNTSLTIHVDFRFNVTNRSALAFWQALGIKDVIVSPELSLPQAQSLLPFSRLIAYGRIPLMLLEKCVGKELGPCSICEKGEMSLKDRAGVTFPVLREWQHRSLVFNSHTTWCSDMDESLRKYHAQALHFIFSTETAREVDRVIDAYLQHLRPSGPFRRIGSL